MTSTDIEFAVLGPAETVRHRAAIRAVHAEVFTEPPYDESPEQIEAFGDQLLDHSDRPGHRCVAAWHGSAMIGFTYAITLPAGRWIRHSDRPGPAHLVEADKCFVIEWAVTAPWRGQGVGAELMRLLLADRPEPYAILGAVPEAAAWRIYQRAGWTEVGSRQPADNNPRLVVGLMQLALPRL